MNRIVPTATRLTASAKALRAQRVLTGSSAPSLHSTSLPLFRPPRQGASHGFLSVSAHGTYVSTRTFSSASTATFDHAEFTSKFLAEVADVTQATDPYQSSQLLRSLIRSKLLKFTDMADAPEKFFLAHRLLSTVGLGGFGVRFTVQFNLFAGSIVGLAGPEQLKMLDEIQDKGQLGCFLLTEMQAGVLSGLIVETTAKYNKATQTFTLHTPSDKAAKNWISQGFTAELGVVIADLEVDGVSHGPHPFFLRLRDDGGNLMPGIRVEDMGTKTVANDLDNARVWFDNVSLPRNALLNRFCEVSEEGIYTTKGEEKMRIEVIGQRLLTGRQCIAEAALLSCRVLHMRTESYAKTKVCNGINGETPLSTMPQVAAVLQQSYAAIDDMLGYVAAVEAELSVCLREGTIPSPELVDKISVAKIRAIEVSLQRAHALRMEVGSYALMHGTGFELQDMLLCCKFAEGDSRILQMKLMRDRLKKVKKDGVLGTLTGGNMKEAMAALSLAKDLGAAGRDLPAVERVLTERWKDVYALSEMVEARILRNTPRRAFIEGKVVDRFRPSATGFDKGWKDKVAQGKPKIGISVHPSPQAALGAA